MPLNTVVEWETMFAKQASRQQEIMKRVRALELNRYSSGVEGLDEGDETVTSVPHTQQQKNQVRARIVVLTNAIIADLQAAIA